MKLNMIVKNGCLLMSAAILMATSALANERELSLKTAVEEALLNNLNLRLEKHRLVESMGVTKAAEGAFDTIATASASHSDSEFSQFSATGIDEEQQTSWSAELQKTFTPGTLVELSWDNSERDTSVPSLNSDPVFSSGVNLRVSQPLLRGFGTEVQTSAIRASEKQEDASAMIVESTSADLAAQVIGAYWDLVFSWQDIEVQKISLELARKLLDETKERIDAGKLAEVELFRPQSEVARREEGLISAERAIGLAEDQIKVLLNSDEWDASIKPTDLPQKDIVELDAQIILANSLKNRPDLRAAELNKEAAEIAFKAAEDRKKPSLSLFGAVGVNGEDDSYGRSLDNLGSDAETSWQVGVTLSRPIRNSFAEGEALQAMASLDLAKTQADLLEQEIRRAVRAAMRDVKLAIKNMEATRKTSLASMKGLEAEQIKFDAGRGTTLDVLIAQENYAAALSQEKLALVSYAKTLAELDRIQGIISFQKPQ